VADTADETREDFDAPSGGGERLAKTAGCPVGLGNPQVTPGHEIALAGLDDDGECALLAVERLRVLAEIEMETADVPERFCDQRPVARVLGDFQRTLLELERLAILSEGLVDVADAPKRLADQHGVAEFLEDRQRAALTVESLRVTAEVRVDATEVGQT